MAISPQQPDPLHVWFQVCGFRQIELRYVGFDQIHFSVLDGQNLHAACRVINCCRTIGSNVLLIPYSLSDSLS